MYRAIFIFTSVCCAFLNGTSPKGYVSNYNDGTISVIDLDTNGVTATISVGTNPYGQVVTRDGAFLYVANGGEQFCKCHQSR